jgi:hypothetical protein
MRNIAPRLGRHIKQRVHDLDIIEHEARRCAADLVCQNHRDAFDVVEIVYHCRRLPKEPAFRIAYEWLEELLRSTIRDMMVTEN